MSVTIHPTAIVDSRAELDDGVTIGAYSVISGKVTLGKNVQVHHHAVVKGTTKVGEGSELFSFCVVGEDPQDLKFKGEDSLLILGSFNKIREFATIHRGTEEGGGKTELGNHNLIMGCCHIAHDCILGDYNIMANYSGLAGHAQVGNYVTFGGYSGVTQKLRVGSYAMLASYTNLRLDCPPYAFVSGNEKAKVVKINQVRLERCAFLKEEVQAIQTAYRIFFRSGLTQKEALSKLQAEFPNQKKVQSFVQFVESSTAGITR